ncbi:hypothetical protein XENORESO_003118, partial [Xenotaenia resolanae]
PCPGLWFPPEQKSKPHIIFKMFLTKSLIGGIINVVSNFDPSQFKPSNPPPPRRPLNAEANENDEEKQFRRVFQQLAGDDAAGLSCSPPAGDMLPVCPSSRFFTSHHTHLPADTTLNIPAPLCFLWVRYVRSIRPVLLLKDMEVSPVELKDILNRIISKRENNVFDANLKTDGFCIESCRSMVAVMDSDSTGKLGFHEFKYLWNNIKRWQNIYLSHDTDRSGTIGSKELPQAFKAAGFPLNEDLFKLIIRRYSDENGDMDFDNFVGCLVRLDAMCRAFKTLDKDNSGTIDLDIKEVFTLISENCLRSVHPLTDLFLHFKPAMASADDVLMKQQRENFFFSFYLDVISMSFFKRDQQKVSTGTKDESCWSFVTLLPGGATTSLLL